MHHIQLRDLEFRQPPILRLLGRAAMEDERAERLTSAGEETIPPRRHQVLSLYVSGYSREEIADQLGLSPHTVRNHIRLVYDQLGVSNRIEALRWALSQPHMSREVLRQYSRSGAVELSPSRRATRRQPESLEEIIDEAITFFQREAIEGSTENR